MEAPQEKTKHKRSDEEEAKLFWSNMEIKLEKYRRQRVVKSKYKQQYPKTVDSIY